jgi:hypothetical protein
LKRIPYLWRKTLRLGVGNTRLLDATALVIGDGQQEIAQIIVLTLTARERLIRLFSCCAQFTQPSFYSVGLDVLERLASRTYALGSLPFFGIPQSTDALLVDPGW